VNQGEMDELYLKMVLVHMRDHGTQGIGPFKLVSQVGSGAYEYREIPSDISLRDIETSYRFSTPLDLGRVLNYTRIAKAPTDLKSDVYINGKGYSVKSFSSAPPAIVNHTARPGFETACKHMNMNIAVLDKLVEEYWMLRSAGKIREDVKNKDPLSPFRNARQVFEPLLHYFLFLGTGQGLSAYPADFILDYIEPVSPYTWKVLSPHNVLDAIWHRLVFSIRAKKGMPSNYPNISDMSKKNSIEKWTRQFQGEYRGALHIRVGT